MKKIQLDESGELKKLAEEFQRMKSADELREKTEAVQVQTQVANAKAAGALPKPVVYSVIAGVVVVLALLGFFGFRGKQQGHAGEIPKVVGLQVDAASEAVKSAGYRPRIAYDATSRALPGEVTAQRPGPGKPAEAGSDVVLTVSGKAPNASDREDRLRPGRHHRRSADEQTSTTNPGTPSTADATGKVTVPDVQGMVEDFARNKLQSAGLKAVVTTREDATQREGVVISCNPQAGAQVDRGAMVQIVVTTTPKQATSGQGQTQTQLVTIGDYFGRSYNEAANDLQSKGLKVTWRSEPSRKQPAGYVIGTEPAANSQVASGSQVTIIVAK